MSGQSDFARQVCVLAESSSLFCIGDVVDLSIFDQPAELVTKAPNNPLFIFTQTEGTYVVDGR